MRTSLKYILKYYFKNKIPKDTPSSQVFDKI